MTRKDKNGDPDAWERVYWEDDFEGMCVSEAFVKDKELISVIKQLEKQEKSVVGLKLTDTGIEVLTTG
jgi:hypothetical protein